MQRRTRKIKWRVGGGAAALVLLAAALNYAGGHVASADVAASDDAPSETAVSEPVNGEISQELQARNDQLFALVEALRAKLGDDFVGTSATNADGVVTTLNVILVNSDAAHASDDMVRDLFVATVPSIPADALRIIYAPVSEKVLLAAYDAFSAIMAKGEPALLSLNSATVDRSSGALVIVLDGKQAERAASDADTIRSWAKSVEPVSVRVTIDSNPEKLSLTDTRESGAPAKAGRRTIDVTRFGDNSPSGGGNCTLAYTVIFSAGANAGIKNATTAGHCGRLGGSDSFKGAWNGSTNAYFHGSGSLNTFFSSANGGHYTNSDAQWLANSNQGNYVNQLFVNSSLTRLITSQRNPSSMTVNATSIAASGITSGVQSGLYKGGPSMQKTIYDDPIYGDDWYRWIDHLYVWGYGAQPGDSGQPLYIASANGDETPAVGLSSISNLVNTSYFNSIQNMQSYDPFDRSLMVGAK